jgi:peroxiredoxin
MTQLVELQAALPRFHAAGIELYAISYDEPSALAEFARHHDITFRLLSDLGSTVIDRFGIRNHFVTEEQVPYYGIPFPGTYLIDEDGVVSAKFFHRNIAQRESAEAIIDSALGEILLGDDEPMAEGGADDIRVTATYHGGNGLMKSGALRQIVVRFDLAPGVHIYAQPVPDGMVATTIGVSGPPGLHVGDTQAPASHPLTLPGLDAALQVWNGQVDFVVPVRADDRIASLVEAIRDEEIEIEVVVDYQACSDESCRIPQRETLTLTVPLAPLVGNALAGTLAGAIPTTMNSRRYLLRMVWRGWRRRPIQGLRYLLQLLRDIWRGPAGRVWPW